METYTEPKALIDNPYYREHRQKKLADLKDANIDAPIIEMIHSFNNSPCCFSLQSCYGHFLYKGCNDPQNLEFLPITDTISRVEYRIAYIAFCIEDSASGRELFGNLRAITAIDTKNIQFCCAEWFWKRQVNSYVLQVEPDRYKRNDRAILDYNEALYIEKIRNEFFIQLDELFKNERNDETG